MPGGCLVCSLCSSSILFLILLLLLPYHPHTSQCIIIYLYMFIHIESYFPSSLISHTHKNKTLKAQTKMMACLSVGWWLRRSIFHQSVNVVLGSVLRRGHFENISHALERLLRVSIRHHLRRREKK